MKELLIKVKKETEKSRNRYATLLEALKIIEKELRENIGNLDIYGQSKKVQLECSGPEGEQGYYGYLSFRNGTLVVCYRATEPDCEDDWNSIPYEYRSYSCVSLDECKSKWLLRLAEEPVVASLLKCIHRRVIEQNSEFDEVLDKLSNLVDNQVNVVLDEFESQLESLKVQDLIDGFKRARESILTNPKESITQSSSFIESVCCFIIEGHGQELPQKNMAPLINTCLKCLDLSPNPKASKDLNQILSGLRSIAQGIGALRTHSGSAHGATPGDYSINSSYAKLCCDSAAVLTSYLLEKHKNK